MPYRRDLTLLAGFWAQQPEPEVPELLEAGEHWAPENYKIEWHQNPGWEILYQAAGRSRWETASGGFTLDAGSYYVIGPGLRHRMKPFTTGRQHYFFVVMDIAGYLPREASARDHWTERVRAHGSDGASLQRPMEPLLREVALKNPYRAQAMRGYLSALVVEATRLLIGRGPEERMMPVHPSAARAKELMESDPGQPWTLEALGAVVGLSPNHLASVFRREVGEPPHQFLLERRLQRAREQLRSTDLTIAQLAMESGFSSSQHFATAFKRRFGRTPREERSGRSSPPHPEK